ncbi:MAG: glycosyltransferase family 4 protein [Gammaproteobacteria bacterium]|nr:glycosyltransferase family 4 protein [Gammaproteobacteria bacterium]MBU1467863.1 glycosyltransferase family 4 protein [Gammaproteobacteria bacterium]MBU2023231.1 glycosyltransferase family 4 protein [Gammaproteobacteria bacterium]MBU2240642.1 glycosyltransferase family 4 protein [Gammaproteobacteria bacterium]MBU2317846.1 glycosyltransferase family 4 protein [Gammaproteobacteria bacterium]
MKVVIIGTVALSIFGFRMPLIKALLKKRYQVFAFAIDYSIEQKNALLNMGVVPVDYDLSRSGLNPISDLKMMFVLMAKLNDLKPDVVLSYFVKPVIYGSLAARLAKVPKRIAMLEGLGFAFTIQPDGQAMKTKIIQKVQLFLYRMAFPATTQLIFLNPDDRDELLTKHKLPSKKSSILGGIGLDLTDYPYQAPHQNKIRFLFIGRLLKEKGILHYLASAKQVKKLYPDVEFIVLGSTDNTSPNALSEKELNNAVQSGLITYPGQVNDVSVWIAKSSVFVLPSFREGVPRSSQEAMAVGRPILTTDVPGCRETVVEGENGFLVPPFDVDKLVEKMIWFIENPDQIEPMGLASRKMAEDKFDVHKVNARMLEIMGL